MCNVTGPTALSLPRGQMFQQLERPGVSSSARTMPHTLPVQCGLRHWRTRVRQHVSRARRPGMTLWRGALQGMLERQCRLQALNLLGTLSAPHPPRHPGAGRDPRCRRFRRACRLAKRFRLWHTSYLNSFGGCHDVFRPEQTIGLSLAVLG